MHTICLKHTENTGLEHKSSETEADPQINWVGAKLLIDHVYLTHHETHITDKWVSTNLRQLKLCGFLGYFFVQSKSLILVFSLIHSAYKWQIRLGDLDGAIQNSLGLHWNEQNKAGTKLLLFVSVDDITQSDLYCICDSPVVCCRND